MLLFYIVSNVFIVHCNNNQGLTAFVLTWNKSERENLVHDLLIALNAITLSIHRQFCFLTAFVSAILPILLILNKWQGRGY